MSSIPSSAIQAIIGILVGVMVATGIFIAVNVTSDISMTSNRKQGENIAQLEESYYQKYDGQNCTGAQIVDLIQSAANDGRYVLVGGEYYVSKYNGGNSTIHIGTPIDEQIEAARANIDPTAVYVGNVRYADNGKILGIEFNPITYDPSTEEIARKPTVDTVGRRSTTNKWTLPTDNINGTPSTPSEQKYNGRDQTQNEASYHRHIDGLGGIHALGDTRVSIDKAGGCYTIPIYHTHSNACVVYHKHVYTALDDEGNPKVVDCFVNEDGTTRELKTTIYLEDRLTLLNQRLTALNDAKSKIGEELAELPDTSDGDIVSDFANAAAEENCYISPVYYEHEHSEACKTVAVHTHVHIDANGKMREDDMVASDDGGGGGCYIVPVYHVHDDSCYTVVRHKHQGNPMEYGWCYTKPVLHQHKLATKTTQYKKAETVTWIAKASFNYRQKATSVTVDTPITTNISHRDDGMGSTSLAYSVTTKYQRTLIDSGAQAALRSIFGNASGEGEMVYTLPTTPNKGLDFSGEISDSKNYSINLASYTVKKKRTKTDTGAYETSEDNLTERFYEATGNAASISVDTANGNFTVNWEDGTWTTFYGALPGYILNAPYGDGNTIYTGTATLVSDNEPITGTEVKRDHLTIKISHFSGLNAYGQEMEADKIVEGSGETEAYHLVDAKIDTKDTCEDADYWMPVYEWEGLRTLKTGYTVQTFKYEDGEDQTYVAPADGKYQILVYGAASGFFDYENVYTIWHGGYQSVTVNLSEGESLLVHLGHVHMGEVYPWDHYNTPTGFDYAQTYVSRKSNNTVIASAGVVNESIHYGYMDTSNLGNGIVTISLTTPLVQEMSMKQANYDASADKDSPSLTNRANYTFSNPSSIPDKKVLTWHGIKSPYYTDEVYEDGKDVVYITGAWIAKNGSYTFAEIEGKEVINEFKNAWIYTDKEPWVYATAGYDSNREDGVYYWYHLGEDGLIETNKVIEHGPNEIGGANIIVNQDGRCSVPGDPHISIAEAGPVRNDDGTYSMPDDVANSVYWDTVYGITEGRKVGDWKKDLWRWEYGGSIEKKEITGPNTYRPATQYYAYLYHYDKYGQKETNKFITYYDEDRAISSTTTLKEGTEVITLADEQGTKKKELIEETTYYDNEHGGLEAKYMDSQGRWVNLVVKHSTRKAGGSEPFTMTVDTEDGNTLYGGRVAERYLDPDVKYTWVMGDRKNGYFQYEAYATISSHTAQWVVDDVVLAQATTRGRTINILDYVAPYGENTIGDYGHIYQDPVTGKYEWDDGKYLYTMRPVLKYYVKIDEWAPGAVFADPYAKYGNQLRIVCGKEKEIDRYAINCGMEEGDIVTGDTMVFDGSYGGKTGKEKPTYTAADITEPTMMTSNSKTYSTKDHIGDPQRVAFSYGDNDMTNIVNADNKNSTFLHKATEDVKGFKDGEFSIYEGKAVLVTRTCKKHMQADVEELHMVTEDQAKAEGSITDWLPGTAWLDEDLNYYKRYQRLLSGGQYLDTIHVYKAQEVPLAFYGAKAIEETVKNPDGSTRQKVTGVERVYKYAKTLASGDPDGYSYGCQEGVIRYYGLLYNDSYGLHNGCGLSDRTLIGYTTGCGMYSVTDEIASRTGDGIKRITYEEVEVDDGSGEGSGKKIQMEEKVVYIKNVTKTFEKCSKGLNSEADELYHTKAINPSTSKPWTKEELYRKYGTNPPQVQEFGGLDTRKSIECYQLGCGHR